MDSFASHFGQNSYFAPSSSFTNPGHKGDLESMMDIHLQMPNLTLSSDETNSQCGSNDGESTGYGSSQSCGIRSRVNDSEDGYSLRTILYNGLLVPFAKERLGSQRLQMLYPLASTEERCAIVHQIIENRAAFMELSCDLFGNHFVQKVMETSTFVEQQYVASHLKNDIFNVCLHRYGNRVVQKAFDVLTDDLKMELIAELAKTNPTGLCVDQNGNYVIQKMMTNLPVSSWAFLVESWIVNEENLFKTIENKYGCIIVQRVIEQLVSFKESTESFNLLKSLMKAIMKHSLRFIPNEGANYVIQYIIGCEHLGQYRDFIIENCLLRNLLSMAQDKHASHVVEKALQHAPSALFEEMMNEIMDGYNPHPETGKDAVDIIMFHQFGNYVVQEMLSACIRTAHSWSAGQTMDGMKQRLVWLRTLSQKISANESALIRCTSGKKMIEILSTVPLMFRIPEPTLADFIQLPPHAF